MIRNAQRQTTLAWANLPLRVKGLVGVAIPLAALLAATVSIYLVVRQHHQAEAWVRRSLEVRAQIQRALTLLVDVETGTRGYVLTGQEAFLEPYQKARQALPQALARLDRLVQDSRIQSERLRRVEARVEERLRLLAAARRYATPGRGPGTQPDALLVQSRTVMDALRRELGAMQTEEERLLAERTRAADRTQKGILATTGVSAALGLLVGLLTTLLFTSGVVHRTERMEENARRLALGLPLFPLLPGDDEIGCLERELEKTSELLTRRETERKQAEQALRESEGFHRALTANFPNGAVVLFDHELRYIIADGKGLADFGFSREEMEGKTLWEALPPEAAELAEPIYRAVLAGEQVVTEAPFANRTRALYGVPVRNERGEIFAGLVMTQDITERKQAEESARQHHENLQRRTAQVEAVNKELEAFSYSVSHDLRAPLRSIDGFSQALLEDYSDQVDDTGQSYLQRIRAATQRMGQLIDDLLNLSRLTRSELRRETVDLSALARSIAGEFCQRDPRRQVEFVIAEGGIVEGDPALLRVVLENLLGNAWKFTGTRSQARIEFGVTRNGGQPAYFVRDDGVGFDMEYAGKLFGAFQRLHAMNEFPGTGIGLATVQRIIHRHGGHTWPEGAVDRGATFFFTLEGGGQNGEEPPPMTGLASQRGVGP